MGRPPIMLSDEQVREVETLAALLNQDQIADYFGISRTTFRAICDRDEEVCTRYKRGKSKAIAHVANSLLQKARAGDTTSAIFYLKTQAGWRERPATEAPETADAEMEASAEEIVRLLDDLAARKSALAVHSPGNATSYSSLALRDVIHSGP